MKTRLHHNESNLLQLESNADRKQFRPSIALRTDLLHITTELWEIPVFSPVDGALNFTYDYIALLFWRNLFSPVLERDPSKGVMRKVCRVSDALWEKMRKHILILNNSYITQLK